MNAKAFTTTHISPTIGSCVKGLDLSKPLTTSIIQQLTKLWLERKVLVFKNQQLTPQQQTSFTEYFGELDQYPFLQPLQGHPYVAEVLKKAEERINFGGVWHSDTSYLKTPAAGASLYAIEVPEVGGDTLFADMQQAYQQLPEQLKNKISLLNALNTSTKAAVAQSRQHRLADNGQTSSAKAFQQIHPVVRCHPQSAKHSLFVNEAHSVHIEGLERSGSDELLNGLYAQARKAEFQCRIRWSKGTLVLWDNRSTQHYPINDYTGFRRLLHRVSLKGDVPFSRV